MRQKKSNKQPDQSQIDEAEKQQIDALYIEILAKPGHRVER